MPILQLTTDAAAEKGKDLWKLITQDIRDRTAVMSKRAIARSLYYGDILYRQRYPGASNIHLPVLTEKVEAMVPKLVNAFFGATPHVLVGRVGKEVHVDGTDNNQDFINWATDSDIPDFYDTIESWIRNMLLDGCSTLKIYYDYTKRNTVEVLGQKAYWQPGEKTHVGQPVEQRTPKSSYDILVDRFGLSNDGIDDGMFEVEVIGGEYDLAAPVDVEGARHIGFSVSFVEGRERYEHILVEFREARYVDEVDVLVHRPIVVQNNPRVEVVEYEDIILPYRTDNIQEAERVTHQYWLTAAEIKQKIEQDGWDITEEEYERLVTESKGNEDRHKQAPDNKTLRWQRDRAVQEYSYNYGSTTDPEAPYADGKVLIFEVYCREDLNKDGTFEEVIYHIPYSLKKIVRSYYLEELYPHGRRPFADAHYIRVSDRWYSISLGELLAPINLEVDAIINMVNESQEIINNPFFFYVPAANTVNPEVLEGIAPGQGIPVADVNGVMFPRFQQEPLANLAAMDSLLLFADRLTIAPQASGSNQTRNAPRTARATLALLSESGIKSDVIITAMQKRGWPELIRQIHALYAAFGPDEKWFRVTGDTEAQRITPAELRGNFEYTFSGNSVNTNREVTRNIAQIRYSTLITNPLVNQDMNALLELTKDFVRHFPEGCNTEALVPKLPGMGGAHPPMDQATEYQIMKLGKNVEALPLDNHIEHIQVLQQIINSPDFENQPEWVAGYVASHLQAHMQQAQAQMQQGGPVPAGGGMANNAPQGMTQSGGGNDLNALEGGVV
jgi:hypothetical protein